ncbi:hypothetical protein BpHYR1_010808 [Brachionus plicatilis]|uniref:Uncharacterized protein n=1 Tax=Brachionus plicatilis TaxID=10195 RepID=A0A3M7Q3H0_BRAPC|nr:hypothetical protein BpHYR1_010808 [Brachionus plicatilis]
MKLFILFKNRDRSKGTSECFRSFEVRQTVSHLTVQLKKDKICNYYLIRLKIFGEIGLSSSKVKKRSGINESNFNLDSIILPNIFIHPKFYKLQKIFSIRMDPKI